MSLSSEHLQQVMSEADCLYTRQDIDCAIQRLVTEITHDFVDKNPLVMCVMNGGLVLAGQLLPQLQFPLQLDYLHATRYRNSTQGYELQWLAEPSSNLTERHLLIVDDIFDEGKTLAGILDYCRAAGAESISSVVLCDKLHDRKVPGLQVDYIGLTVPDRYVFGFGMDYQGFWRNADGIYALADTHNGGSSI